jgi:hypothetical protein
MWGVNQGYVVYQSISLKWIIGEVPNQDGSMALLVMTRHISITYKTIIRIE